MLLINGLKLDLNHNENDLKQLIEKKLKHPINSFEIKRKSLDARKNPLYVYSVIVDIDNEDKYLSKDIVKYHKENLNAEYIKRNKKCIVVGYGPAGIFAAYRLIEAGYDVSVFEKGKRIKQRELDVDRFFKEGILDENSNVQFGEGGAGTFSDAKLTTRIKNKYIEYILDVFVKHGAKESIKYENHAHIGTDEIRIIISKITDYLISKGCDFHFEEEIIDLDIKNNEISLIKTKKGEYQADYYLFATGHSSHSIYSLFKQKGIYMSKKDIALGFRVEHPQSLINQRQTNNLINEANEYLLRYKDEKGVYSFCMCPGGIVIPAMSENNTIVTNGMSYSSRDSGVANSAILIQVNKDEFDDGFIFLKHYEQLAYNYSNSYKALSQNIKDFMNNELNELIFKSTYPLGTVLYNFNDLFNEYDLKIIKKALLDFDLKIPGFIDSGIMVGPETRSSCPIRINRNESYQSINTSNLYPIGEGAGYGGGIMSCALDGIRIANAIISNYE